MSDENVELNAEYKNFELKSIEEFYEIYNKNVTDNKDLTLYIKKEYYPNDPIHQTFINKAPILTVYNYQGFTDDFGDYWNQLTPENETKWASVEGTRDVYNWGAVDRHYQYCKDHNIPFKFHTLIV